MDLQKLPWAFLLENFFFIFSLAFPILYRLASLGLLKTTPRPTNWVKVMRLGSRVLGLRGHRCLICVVCRLKHLPLGFAHPCLHNATHQKGQSSVTVYTVVSLHPSMLHAAHPATPCEQHASTSHLCVFSASSLPM